jgi:hypothetical protein
MTRYTAPNQKIIRVHKDSYDGGYLTIGTEEWQEAFKSLKRITFGVYLYLSGNANGFELTLSRRDVMNRLGVSKDTYLRAVKELEEKGYLAHKNGPVWNFYTTPVDMGTDVKETDVNESDDDNENNESYESGDYESDNNESSSYEESNESDGDENMGGMVAYTQPSCMRTRNHNGSVEATDMVAYTHTEINKYRETDNTDRVGSDEPPNIDDENTDEKSKRDTMNAKDEEDIKYRENQREDEESLREKNPREGNEATRNEATREEKNQMKKEDLRGKEGSREKENQKEKNRWVNDTDFLESLSEEETHEMHDSFCTENGFDSNGMKKFLLDRYGVKVRDIRRFYDNLCLYCEE